MGGNGTKEKPFRDPFQALEKMRERRHDPCDRRRVLSASSRSAPGGSTPTSSPCRRLQQGVHGAQSWKYPSLLYCPETSRARRGGYTIDGDTDDHTGAVIDGFVFDKKLNNFYKADGDIEASRSDNKEAIWLHRPGSVVRNCVFVNQAGGALRMCNGSIIENNIIVNSWGRGGYLTRAHTTPAIFRNNTILFAWDLKAGPATAARASVFRFETDVRAVDRQQHLRVLGQRRHPQFAVESAEIVLTNNAFSHNLWSHV
jgi:hypothetical protein